MTNEKPLKSGRLVAIDALRALTMLLLIFVNDFWTLIGVPKWLSHARAGEDYLGFSDIIFPLFLFIVGLSIPFAINHRRSNGESTGSISLHILIRFLSLLVMGVFMVNHENIHGASVLIGRHGWGLLMALGIALIWIDWGKSRLSPKWGKILQISGLVLLMVLAAIYRGGEEGIYWMRPYWWGILGLIGWAYLASALIYLFSKGNLKVITATFLAFHFLAIAKQAGWLPELGPLASRFSTLINGTIPAFTAAGMFASVLFRHQKQQSTEKSIYFALLAIGFASIAYGFAMRPLWGISKIDATPAWLGICSGIGFLSFAFFYWLCDQKGIVKWYKIIAPAGTATLTCYLIPYFIYPLREMSGLLLPEHLRIGSIGLFKALCFALLIVLLTGWLEKKKIKLKL